jgi:microcystin-dependent protein
MAEPFLGEIRMFSSRTAPTGWALCNGQLLPINQNQALFSLLGTFFGGNGTTQFALPDLRARIPLHRGPSIGFSKAGGSTSQTLSLSQMPQHNHVLLADNTLPASPGGQLPTPNRRLSRSEPGVLYGSAANLQAMAAGSVTPVGGGQAHNNLMPYLTISFCIALQGIFPPRN